MADLTHKAAREIDQRPDVVHVRLLELANRLRSELPPVEAGTQLAGLLGMSGPLGLEVADRGPDRIELRTTNGRIRGEAAATIEPLDGGARTHLALAAAIRPQGFAANLMLGAGLRMMPTLEADVRSGLENALDDLASELAKPDETWDAAGWTPPGVPR